MCEIENDFKEPEQLRGLAGAPSIVDFFDIDFRSDALGGIL